MSGKYSPGMVAMLQKRFNQDKQSATMQLKCLHQKQQNEPVI